MKFSMVAVMSLGILAVASAFAQDKPDSSGLKDARQKASYGIGLSIGKNLKSQADDLDSEVFIQGLKDALSGKPPMLTDKQIEESVIAYQQDLVSRKIKEGEAYLAENKKKPGVTTLPSGLQYKVIKQGTGKQPKPGDTVTVNYEGRLTDKEGTVFDSSAKHGGPASFQVDGVIKRFSEALKMMKVGSKWEVCIPSNLAYGPTPPQGSRITPNAPLVFDLELVDVKEGSAAGAK